jgi:tetratricopeptide (TPR) repeat protein
MMTALVGFSLAMLAWAGQVSAQASASALFKQGTSCLLNGNHEQAVTEFSKALGLVKPDSSDAHTILLARGHAYYEADRFKEALIDLAAVLNSRQASGESIASAYQLRGLIHLKRDAAEKAIKDFTTAIKTSHENIELRAVAFSNRGIAYINHGNYDRAISDLNKAIELDPSSGFAYAGRGLAYLRSDNIERARRDARQALRLNPDSRTKSISEGILRELSVSASGPLSVVVPLSDHGQVFVQVRFSKRGAPHRFLLDTGATFSLVSHDLLEKIARETSVRKIGKGTVTTADGTRHQVSRYEIEQAFLYTLPLGRIEVHVFDRDPKGILNLLGTTSISSFSVSIDNSRRRVTISRRESLAR